MADLTQEQIRAMGAAVGLEFTDQDLVEVAYGLNAVLEALGEIDLPDLEHVEPLPVYPPPDLQKLVPGA